jgi:zinc transport system substrate-binding protein
MLFVTHFTSRMCLLLAFGCMSAVASDTTSVLPSTYALSLLVKEVTGGEHGALLPANVSPHDFSLKPSHIRRLQSAALVVWFGPKIEPYLAKVMLQIPAHKQLILNQGLSVSSYGMHPWTSPKYLLQGMQQLSQYLGKGWNETVWLQQIDELKLELVANARVMSERNQGYVVYHNGISAFESYFGLSHLATFTDADDQPPGAKQLAVIDQLAKNNQVACVLMDHEAQPKLVDAVLGSGVRRIKIDILATNSSSLMGYLTKLKQALLRCGEG